MGILDVAGTVAGGYAAGRNARLANEKANEQSELLKQLAAQKTPVAQGVGGEPVTTTGSPIPASSGASKSLGKRIGSGLMSILGFAKGGRVTKSGVAFVHAGETIIPARKSKERKALRISVRKSGRR